MYEKHKYDTEIVGFISQQMNCFMQNNNQCTNNKKATHFFYLLFTKNKNNNNVKKTVIAFITAVRTKIYMRN